MRSVTAMSKSTPKPKALFIGPYPPPYAGPEIGMKLFLDSSLKDSFDVIFLNTNVRSDNVNKGRFDHHMVLAFFRFFSRLIYLIVRRRPRVAYYPVTATALGWVGRDIWCLLLCRLFGISTVIHLRGSHLKLNVRKFAPWARWLARLSCRKVSLALVQADCLRDQFDGWVPRNRVRVLYQAIDTKTYDNDELENFDQNQILFIGNMTKSKGYCDVVRSIPVVAERFPNIRFLFAGDLGSRERTVFYNQVTGEKLVYEQPSHLHDEIVSGPFKDNYEHLGVVSGSEKLRLIRDANIFVLPSYSEGFSRALLEAMSMGKPVICTPVGAHGEVVQDGLHGLLMAPGDVGKLAQNIIRLLEDADLRKKIALANYRYVRENFDIAKIARRMEQILKEVAR